MREQETTFCEAVLAFLALVALVFAILFFLAGCTVLTYDDGKVKFTRTAVGTDLHIQGVEVTETATGKRILVQGATSEQAATAAAIAEGVARGIAP